MKFAYFNWPGAWMVNNWVFMTIACHRWSSRNNRAKRIFGFFLCCLHLLFGILFDTNAGEPIFCRSAVPSMGVFSGDGIYKDSIIAAEKTAEEHAINLSLYRWEGSACKKTTFAKYPREGGEPDVDFIFFLKINGKPNVFSIVHWDINSRGAGTYGKYYRIYSYLDDNRGGLMENEDVVNNSTMAGMDGYQEGEQISFAYKNAESVRNFFKCEKAVCR